jgi:hypothetical protein
VAFWVSVLSLIGASRNPVEIRDYNGTGDWTVEAVTQRYEAHSKRHGRATLRDLRPHDHREGDVRWVYPIMDAVADGIKAGDPACVDLGVEFIESAQKQPFGRILRARVARSLRQTSLTSEHVTRLRVRILAMLVASQVPREYREYAKLLRRIGLGDGWPDARSRVDEANPYVMRYVNYFDRFAA